MVEQADGLSHYMMTFGFYVGYCLNRLKFVHNPLSRAKSIDCKTKSIRFLIYLVAALPAIILFVQYEIFKGGFEENKDYEGKAWYKYGSNTLYGIYTGLSTMFLAPKLLQKWNYGFERDSVNLNIGEPKEAKIKMEVQENDQKVSELVK